MKVIRREWFNVKPTDEFRIYPTGDWQLGARGVNEPLLESIVREIAADERAWWIGMGDYADFINRTDKRFDPRVLAAWFRMSDLDDLASAQIRRARSIIRPIAAKTLAMVGGNHERDFMRHTERDVYREIIRNTKEDAGFADDYPLAIGYYGYLDLVFYRGADRKQGSAMYRFSLHHGFGGGRLKGGKGLNMERWLWTHECDVALFGHTHNMDIFSAAVEYVDKAGRIRTQRRFGAYCGTFLLDKAEDVDDYGTVKGYLPLPYGNVRVDLRPLDRDRSKAIRIVGF